jgi:hypothetical protein
VSLLWAGERCVRRLEDVGLTMCLPRWLRLEPWLPLGRVALMGVGVG